MHTNSIFKLLPTFKPFSVIIDIYLSCVSFNIFKSLYFTYLLYQNYLPTTIIVIQFLYLSVYLFLSMSFILMLLCYFLASFSTWRARFSISYKTSLVVNSSSFCLSGKIILSPFFWRIILQSMLFLLGSPTPTPSPLSL